MCKVLVIKGIGISNFDTLMGQKFLGGNK